MEHTFDAPGANPNRPAVDSENMRRAFGEPAPVTALQPEPGNVWPGPSRPDPTLTDIEQQQNRETGGTAQPGAQLNQQQGGQQNDQRSQRPRGSSTPPPPVPPRSSGEPGVPPFPVPPPSVFPPPAPGQAPPGGVVNTPRGNQFDAGGTNSYRQLTAPGTPGAIVVPNGNGTSTVISPNGGVQVIPTPR